MHPICIFAPYPSLPHRCADRAFPISCAIIARRLHALAGAAQPYTVPSGGAACAHLQPRARLCLQPQPGREAVRCLGFECLQPLQLQCHLDVVGFCSRRSAACHPRILNYDYNAPVHAPASLGSPVGMYPCAGGAFPVSTSIPRRLQLLSGSVPCGGAACGDLRPQPRARLQPQPGRMPCPAVLCCSSCSAAHRCRPCSNVCKPTCASLF